MVDNKQPRHWHPKHALLKNITVAIQYSRSCLCFYIVIFLQLPEILLLRIHLVSRPEASLFLHWQNTSATAWVSEKHQYQTCTSSQWLPSCLSVKYYSEWRRHKTLGKMIAANTNSNDYYLHLDPESWQYLSWVVLKWVYHGAFRTVLLVHPI